MPAVTLSNFGWMGGRPGGLHISRGMRQMSAFPGSTTAHIYAH